MGLDRVDRINIVPGAVGGAELGYAADAVVVAQRGATDAASGTNLKAAYAAACALTPGGNALAADNRAAVLVAGGKWDFGSTKITFDTDFVDVIGQGICRCDCGPAITWTGQPYASVVSAIDLSNAIFHWPDSHLICDTDDVVVEVTCRDILFKGFFIESETSGKDALKIDNADACDKGRFIDLGFVLNAVGDEAIIDGTNTEIASYFENCHSRSEMFFDCVTLSGFCKTCTGACGSFCYGGGGIVSGTFIDCVGALNSFGYGGTVSGTFIDCVGEGGSFGGHGTASGTFINCMSGNKGFGDEGTASGTFINCMSGNEGFGGYGTASGTFIDCIGGALSFGKVASTPAALMQRCKSLGRSDAIKEWQGTMIDCDIEVIGAGKDAVELASCYVGVEKTSTDDAANTDTNLRIMAEDCTAEFPVGSFIKHTDQSSWHRVTAAIFTDPDTDITLSPAVGGADDWKSQTVRAHSAPRIINCRLICTSEAIDTDAETPCLVDGVISNKDWDDTDCVNMIAAAANRFDEEHLAALFETFP